jgi:hypothetical protein
MVEPYEAEPQKSEQKRLREVQSLTLVCAACFLVQFVGWLPAFLRLALVVHVLFFVLVFVAFLVFVVVFVFFFLVCGPFRGTRLVGERSHWRSPSLSCSNKCRLASSTAAAARAIATAFSHSSFCGSDLESTPA